MIGSLVAPDVAVAPALEVATELAGAGAAGALVTALDLVEGEGRHRRRLPSLTHLRVPDDVPTCFGAHRSPAFGAAQAEGALAAKVATSTAPITAGTDFDDEPFMP